MSEQDNIRKEISKISEAFDRRFTEFKVRYNAMQARVAELEAALEQVRTIAYQRDVVNSWALLRDEVERIEQIAADALKAGADHE